VAFYDQIERMRDGRILLYTTLSAKTQIWQMRLNIYGDHDDNGKSVPYRIESTHTTNLAEAARKAENEYDRIAQRLRDNAQIDDWSFERHWQDWWDRNCRAGAWKAFEG
jgi:hypothetical protein